MSELFCYPNSEEIKTGEVATMNRQRDTEWRTTRRYNQSDTIKDQGEKIDTDQQSDQNKEVRSRIIYYYPEDVYNIGLPWLVYPFH